jgi:exodeoxyribonuclease VII small subunit
VESKKKKSKNQLSFEQALNELEQIAQKLEGGNISLEKSIELFEQGIKLSKLCNEMLEEAEGKIEMLQKNHNSEHISKKRLEMNEENDEFDDEDIQGTLL